MGVKTRKLFIWFISMWALIAIYLLVSFLSKTPPIKIGTTTEFADTIGEFDSNVRMVGDKGIGTIKKAEFLQLNENKQVVGKFGFERLLRKVADEWETEKPYVDILRDNFKCHITGEKGFFRVENAVGSTRLKEAAFSGNVVIRISAKAGLFSVGRPDVNSPAKISGRIKVPPPDTPLIGGTKLKPPTANRQVVEQTEGQYYSCVLSKNIVIDSPEYLVFVADWLLINNIFSSKTSSEKSGSADTIGADDTKVRGAAVTEQGEPIESSEQLIDIVITCDGGIVLMPMDSTTATKSPVDSEVTVTAGKDLKSFGDILGQKRYALSAPKLTVDLSKDKASANDIEHLTATGGIVQLVTVKRAGQKLLGFTKLKALKFDYIPDQQLFLATGPGEIEVDNSTVSEPNSQLGEFSLQKSCYAVVRNFDTLQCFLQENRIVADNSRDGILIDYLPIVKGQYGQQISATAAHIEADLRQIAEDEFELSTLTATGGITYKDGDVQFEGSEFFFDANTSLIKASGDESWPCLLNGALVDGIEYDPKTGRAKAKIVAPGAF